MFTFVYNVTSKFSVRTYAFIHKYPNTDYIRKNLVHGKVTEVTYTQNVGIDAYV
jgi:hypothetical protein